MNPIALLLIGIGLVLILFGLVVLRKRNLFAGFGAALLGLMFVGAPFTISYFLATTTP